MIPVYEPDLTGNEERYLLDAFRSGWISSKGPFVDRFEREFASFVGSESPGISVSNGTVALHLALLGLGLGHHDEVLMPDFTYVACANAVSYTGATPVFFGSDEQDLQGSLASARLAVTDKTKAILLPHLYGAPADVVGFRSLADELKLFLIEDCAEAIGTYVDGRHVGAWGDVATFSFFGNKTLTTGEGGMVFTANQELATSMRKIKNQGLSAPGSYFHDRIGYNYRMTNLQAAIGVAQTERAAEIIEKKRTNHLLYLDGLRSHNELRLLEPKRGVSSYWMETLIFDLDMTPEHIIEALKSHGIESRPGFAEMSSLPMYRPISQKSGDDRLVGGRLINLPSSPLLTPENIQYICNAIVKICNLS